MLSHAVYVLTSKTVIFTSATALSRCMCCVMKHSIFIYLWLYSHWINYIWGNNVWIIVFLSPLIFVLAVHSLSMTLDQGWGQFHFFNSIPIPIPLFSIPIPPLTISFNSNSNSNSGDFNSNSNSGDFKSRQSQFWKWPIDVFFEIDHIYTNKVHTYKIIVINTIILISLVKWL